MLTSQIIEAVNKLHVAFCELENAKSDHEEHRARIRLNTSWRVLSDEISVHAQAEVSRAIKTWVLPSEQPSEASIKDIFLK